MTAVAETRPYAWPFDGRLATTDFAFVVATGTSAGESGAAPRGVLDACAEFASEVRELGGSVVWVACCGSALPDVVADGEMTATTPSATGMIGGELELILRSQGIDRFALAGWPLEIAVHSTLRRANDLGYECLLLEDLSEPLDPSLQHSAVSQILMSGGIFGAVGDSGSLLEALKTSNLQGVDA
ncbi:MAG: cysteine hydrolase family protein [Solirubrobacterales bacterium]